MLEMTNSCITHIHLALMLFRLVLKETTGILYAVCRKQCCMQLCVLPSFKHSPFFLAHADSCDCGAAIT